MEIAKWTGLRNSDAPERFKPGDLGEAKDVDVDDSGAIRTRLGQTAVNGTPSHSLWAKDQMCLLVQGTDLKRMAENGTLTTLKRLQYGGQVSYAELNGVVYFSNGVDTGRVVEGAWREWGIRPPTGQPGVSASVGSLPPGRYLYAMTFLRSDDQESGARPPAYVDMPVSGGITFTNIEASSDPYVVGRVLYISGPNGTELYRAAIVPNGVNTYSYTNAGTDTTAALDREPVRPPPPGTVVEIHKGVSYLVDGHVVWASEQYGLERFRPASRFLQMPGKVTLFAAVDDGIFVATDRETWFLTGTEVGTLKARSILSYGAVPGTSAKFDTELLSEDGEKTGVNAAAALWVTQFGVILGVTGGQVRNLTEGKYSFPTAQSGAGLVRTARGYSSYIGVLKGAGVAPNEYR
jgi:hypothetical protein